MEDAGAVVWLTGLPGSGKSTLAERARGALRARGRAVAVLDGDAVRAAVHPQAGHDPGARDDRYRTLAELAALLARQGLVVLVPATAHRRVWRERARSGAPRFVEVWVRTPLDECARRDPKGLYERARRGEIAEMPGFDVPYEPPPSPEVVADGGRDDLAVEAIVQLTGGS